MLFLANMLAKMKQATPLGSRVAEVHNGSSLFTGDAGQGESNIRRWLIENDWLEAMVERPLRLRVSLGEEARAAFGRACAEAGEMVVAELVDRAAARLGVGPHLDFNQLLEERQALAERAGVKLTAKRTKLVQTALAER